MTVEELIFGVKVMRFKGTERGAFKSLHFDSRKVKKNDVFVAVRGTQVDGHRFIENAEKQGAKVIVCEELPQNISEAVTYVLVENSAIALALMASNLYENPSRELQLVGVTGTNGKTTTTTLLFDLFRKMGFKTGLLSTIENKINDEIIPATHTTPDPIALNAMLRKMVESGCEYAFMEVSSHAIHQHRVTGLSFAGGVFTNLSHDHLDYHKTFLEYINAKKAFFDNLEKTAFALVNIDDKRGEVMTQNTRARKITYSLKRPADLKVRILENSLVGLHLQLDGFEFYGRLIGEFNAYNLLAAYGVAINLGIPKEEVLQYLSILKSAEGRFDYAQHPKKKITGIIDYAHTPDALQKVLETINQLKPKMAKVITVVGAGGDRDKAKRPKMARIGAILSDTLILTSDNPRTENPETILDEMEEGLNENELEKMLRISDRKQAIKTAVRLAQKGDIVLVAGKGHEKYQDVAGEKHPFDDKEIFSNS